MIFDIFLESLPETNMINKSTPGEEDIPRGDFRGGEGVVPSPWKLGKQVKLLLVTRLVLTGKQ